MNEYIECSLKLCDSMMYYKRLAVENEIELKEFIADILPQQKNKTAKI